MSLPLAGGLDGEIGLIVSDTLRDHARSARTRRDAHLERPRPHSKPAPPRSARSAGAEVQLGRAHRGRASSTSLAPDGGDILVYPLLQNDERVACLVIRLAEVDESSTSVARHEYAVLGEGAPGFGGSRPLAILNDVEMGVTAELGRRRMTVRDLLALTPGSVIELDRAAGTPVDVLVNGTLIARGEVVVIDEEFGIRIAEIVAAESMGAA